MGTIKCSAIEKPVNNFSCKVLRGESDMKYINANGELIPVKAERWEDWNVLAETENGAIRIAEYHFYRTDKNNILLNQPVNQ